LWSEFLEDRPLAPPTAALPSAANRPPIAAAL
jgi:hypothetical protein